MKYLRPVSGYTRTDHVRNEDIRREFDIFSISKKVKFYRKRWGNI